MTSRDGLDDVRFVVDDLTGVDLGDLHGAIGRTCRTDERSV